MLSESGIQIAMKSLESVIGYRCGGDHLLDDLCDAPQTDPNESSNICTASSIERYRGDKIKDLKTERAHQLMIQVMKKKVKRIP